MRFFKKLKSADFAFLSEMTNEYTGMPGFGLPHVDLVTAAMLGDAQIDP